MAELVDALGSGSSVGSHVGVRVPSSAPELSAALMAAFFHSLGINKKGNLLLIVEGLGIIKKEAVLVSATPIKTGP